MSYIPLEEFMIQSGHRMDVYLEQMIKPLLTEPEALKITKTVDEMGVLLTVDIGSQDMGFIIGKQGQNIDKIRKVVALYGTKCNAKISIKINEPIRRYAEPNREQPSAK